MRTTERLVDGDVGELLRIRRARGDSWATISRDLLAEHGIDVSADTLRQWAKAFGIPTKRNGDQP